VRRTLAIVAASLFATEFALFDVITRGASAYSSEPRLLIGLGASITLATSILSLRSTALRTALAALLAWVLGAQALFVHFWHVPIDRQIAVSAVFHSADVGAVLRSMAGPIGFVFAIGAISNVALTRWAPGMNRTTSVRVRMLTAAMLGAMLLVGPPLRTGTGELCFVDAAAWVLFAPRDGHAEMHRTRPTTPIEVRTRPLPNVVFILNESVRASDACAAPEGPCATMPAVSALVPDRIPLREMRAVSSYTAVSLSALLTGRTQLGDRAVITGAPTLFELVHRLRAGGAKPHVAYWSAQMAAELEREDMRAAIDSFVTVESLLSEKVQDDDRVVDRGVDRLLLRYALGELDRLPQPFFLFIQLAGTHAPYFVDPEKAPFEPWSRVVGWSRLEELHNAYRNAIVAQDETVAELLRRIFAKTADAPLFVVYTSDHGEAFGEHGAIHHGQNLYDEQIHVPAWIVSRGGALSADRIARLREHERTFVTHLDLLPTFLDFYGAWDAFALRDARNGVTGRSLFDPVAPRDPVPVTNCTSMFPCPLNAWGMLGEERTLQAQVWDADWRCLALGDPSQTFSIEDTRCQSLRAASQQAFTTMPNNKPNR
jgi:glucan phosphoethanolaminetransferase (alkaline phosphatase superfamily)